MTINESKHVVSTEIQSFGKNAKRNIVISVVSGVKGYNILVTPSENIVPNILRSIPAEKVMKKYRALVKHYKAEVMAQANSASQGEAFVTCNSTVSQTYFNCFTLKHDVL